MKSGLNSVPPEAARIVSGGRTPVDRSRRLLRSNEAVVVGAAVLVPGYVSVVNRCPLANISTLDPGANEAFPNWTSPTSSVDPALGTVRSAKSRPIGTVPPSIGMRIGAARIFVGAAPTSTPARMTPGSRDHLHTFQPNCTLLIFLASRRHQRGCRRLNLLRGAAEGLFHRRSAGDDIVERFSEHAVHHAVVRLPPAPGV